MIGVERRAVGGAQSAHRRHVLDADRQAVKRTRRLPAREALVERGRLVQRPRVESHHGIDLAVLLFDPPQRGFDHLAGGDLATDEPAADLGSALEQEAGHG